MNIQERLIQDLKSALLEKNEVGTSVLRMLKSELKYAEISAGAELNEEQTLQVVRREIKKRRDAVELYRKNDKEDIAQREEQEAAFLANYLPQQADPEEIKAFVIEQAKGLTNPTPKDKGQLIKDTMLKFGSRADGKVVAEIVTGVLAEVTGFTMGNFLS